MKHNIKITEEINLLLKKHRSLDDEADRLSARKYLSPLERQKLKILKINKLRAKDKIRFLRNTVDERDESA